MSVTSGEVRWVPDVSDGLKSRPSRLRDQPALLGCLSELDVLIPRRRPRPSTAKLAEAVQCVGDATLIAGILQGCDREVEIVNCMAMKFDCGVYLAERGK